MNFANESVRERKPFAKSSESVIEGGDIIRDFHDVVERNAGRLLELEEKEIGERRLSSLDLRGKHGLLADVRVEEEVRVGKKRGNAVQPAKGEKRGFERLLESLIELERGDWRERSRHERLYPLAPDPRDFISACGPALHERQSLSPSEES